MTAELQENGNIHFHILWDQFFPIKWLTKIWGQASNSVDIEKMKNPLHAANYMRKYITKDQTSHIRGNRYNISAGLRATMKPIEKVIAEMTHSQAIGQKGGEILEEMRDTLMAAQSMIEARGGRVIDAGFGFSVPAPRSSKEYTDRKTGEKKRSRGVDPRLGKRIVSMLSTFGEQINAQIAPF
ncbi:hypothetical protein [Geomonas diazotrophica]